MRLPRRSLVILLVSAPAALAAALTLSASCKVEPDAIDSDRQQVLRDLVANVIVPTYADLAAATAQLQSVTTALRQGPSAETLAEAQRVYRTARTQLKTSEAFLFGPADDIAITGGAIDNWPADGAKIDALLASDAPLDPGQVARLGADQRGFPALEYLLFDSSVADAEVLARFSTANSAARRGQLSESVASDLAAKCRAVLDAWNNGYANELTEAGVSSKTFATQSQGIDRLVTGLVSLTELMTMKKLAKPLGLDTDNQAHPELEESPRSDSSLADLHDDLLGMQAIYTGQRGERVGKGLAAPLQAMNAAAATSFEQALAAAQAAVAAVPPPMRVALTQNRASLEAAYQAVRALKQEIQTRFAGALGANIGFGFSDTD